MLLPFTLLPPFRWQGAMAGGGEARGLGLVSRGSSPLACTYHSCLLPTDDDDDDDNDDDGVLTLQQ